MLKIILMFILSTNLFSGEIKPGSVPGSINYQGRIEKDNSPITGVIHLKFRLYNALTGGTLRWESPEIISNVVGGIFSATFTPPAYITINESQRALFGNGEQLYLEIQVESETLSPREPINSVIYSLVSKRLEDGANVFVSTLTADYQVLLATTPFSKVGIGTNSPATKLSVNGDVKINNGQLCVEDTCVSSLLISGSGSATDIYSASTATIVAAGNNLGNRGDIIFKFGPSGSQLSKMILNYDGNLGIGTMTPSEKLHVNGNSYITGNLILDGVLNNGIINGANGERIELGSENDKIKFFSGSQERMTIYSNGYVGINNTAPSQPLDVSGNIRSDSGILSGNVIIGNYSSGNTSELRANLGNLYLQYTNTANVGIGNNNPQEKLHVSGNILSDYGIKSATAIFTNDVNISGNLTANGYGKKITLSSTTIYGTLQVFGPVGSSYGFPAYISQNNDFWNLNTFHNDIKITSSTIINERLGVGISDFNFGQGKYLQVGDNNPSYTDGIINIVSGNGNSIINFYKVDNTKVGSIETTGDSSIKDTIEIKIQGQTKAYLNSNSFKIYNSALLVSPSANDSSPSIYVNPSNDNVGIGTVSTPEKLNISGSIKLTGSGSAIIFPDGSSMTTSSATAASSVSASKDALVWAGTTDPTGKVLLKSGSNIGLAVNSNGHVGIGTLEPSSLLNVSGGNLMIGNTNNPYAGANNLIVAGNIVVDGEIRQRSSIPVQLAGLTVSGDVSLSIAASAKTGIGLTEPAHKLDVSGDINTSGNIMTGGKVRIDSSGNIKDSDQTNNLLLPDLSADDYIVTENLTQTLTNKTLTSPILQGTVSAGTGLTMPDFDSGKINGTSINLSGQFTTESTATFKGGSDADYSIETSSGIHIKAGTIRIDNGAVINCTDCIALGSETTGNYVASITAGTGISVTGGVGEGVSPTVALTGQARAILNLNTTGIIVFSTNTGSFTTVSIQASSSNKISVVNGDGTTGNPSIDVNEANLTLNNIGGSEILSISKGGTGTSNPGTGLVNSDSNESAFSTTSTSTGTVLCLKTANTIGYCTNISTNTGSCNCN